MKAEKPMTDHTETFPAICIIKNLFYVALKCSNT